MDKACHIILISTIAEDEYARNHLTNSIGVSFDDKYFSFTSDGYNVFVYDIQLMWNRIINIFTDPSLIKFIPKYIGSLQKIIGSDYINTYNINDYVMKYGDARQIVKFKNYVMQCGEINNSIERTSLISCAIIKSKNNADKFVKNIKQKKNYFNKKRDCYLYYLTLVNEILSTYGPMYQHMLVDSISKYPNICRTPSNPKRIVENLIKVGAIIRNSYSNKIYLPDQDI